jgi:hypothetical protein
MTGSGRYEFDVPPENQFEVRTAVHLHIVIAKPECSGSVDNDVPLTLKGRRDAGDLLLAYVAWLRAHGIDPETGRMTAEGLAFFKTLLDEQHPRSRGVVATNARFDGTASYTESRGTNGDRGRSARCSEELDRGCGQPHVDALADERVRHRVGVLLDGDVVADVDRGRGPVGVLEGV